MRTRNACCAVGGKLRDDRRPPPLQLDLYRGMRVYLTGNVRKSCDFVNGMGAEVIGHDEASACIHVATKTGRQLAVYSFAEDVEDFPGKYSCVVVWELWRRPPGVPPPQGPFPLLCGLV